MTTEAATRLDLGDPGTEINPHDMLMSKTLAEALHKHYPGHLWGVNVDCRKGTIEIRDLYLAGNWGYVLKMDAMYSISALEKDAIRAGGEILERFRMSRGTFSQDAYASAPVDFAGRLTFDKS